MSREQQIVLVRHAETAWSAAGRHTGRTDLPLLDESRRKARRIGDRLCDRTFARVLTSPLQRAAETCALAGYADQAELRDDLMEWDYGEYDGRTTAAIRAEAPGWVLWHDGAPGGESPEDVGKRVGRLVDEFCDACQDGGDVLAFAHGHLLQALAVRWVDLPIDAGRLLRLRTGSISTLSWKRELRVIDVWNDTGHLST